MKALVVFLTCLSFSVLHAQPTLLSSVDPYIGTGAHGHTFLGASVPFGAVQVGPSNINKGWDWCSGYNYSDSVVKGFAQNHLNGTGIPDLGDILIMPFTGKVRTEPGSQTRPTDGYASHYDHQHEIGEYFTRYFDSTTRFMRPVLADGQFRSPFSPFQSIHEWGDYTEGNTWQYTWLVPQNVEKLITLLGGDKPFVSKLDSLFVVTGSLGSEASPDISGLVGMYAQGNEPNHHIPYLYAFAGSQWKTAEKITRITREMYTAKNDGLCGNDDAGQMSAANGIFVFGTPLVRKAILKNFTMETVNFGPKNVYIQRATLNGLPYTKSYISFQQLNAGSILKFYMGDKPNKEFGAAPADRPVSIPPMDTTTTIYVNQAIFPPTGAKIAVIGSTTTLPSVFTIIDTTGATVFNGHLSKPQKIDDWAPGKHFYQADYSTFNTPGTYRLNIASVTSEKFTIGDADWARPLVSAIIHYYHGQRANTPQEIAADSHLLLYGSDRRVDLHGGWCDASGDVSKYFSHLAYANFMSPQQTPLVTWSLVNAGEKLRPALAKWGLTDSLLAEALWGADYITRSLSPEGYFYMTIFSYFKKDPEARRVVGLHANSVTTDEYQCAFREGGGMAIAALARISRWGKSGDYTPQQYLDAARRAYAHLVVNNTKYDDDGKENIIDDYCALMAATELWIATDSNYYRDQARIRAAHLNTRMTPAGYFISDDGSRPFWHASDAGLPIVALTRYLDKEEDTSFRTPALSTIRQALAYNLRVTAGVPNPFGYARQTFRYKNSIVDGFFIPHDNETGWWWQGENARLASLATAALLGRRLLSASTPSPASSIPSLDSLSVFASRQLSWILGCNPYSICFMYQFGKNNVPYMSSNYGHGSQMGGISNGITGMKDHGDGSGIDFRTSDNGNEWRWTEQWIPHAAWFLQAITAMSSQK
jgi:hypothetical protein